MGVEEVSLVYRALRCELCLVIAKGVDVLMYRVCMASSERKLWNWGQILKPPFYKFVKGLRKTLFAEDC